MMKALIVEDEKLAAERLIELIEETDSSIEIVDVLTNIRDTVSWLEKNTADIIFLDIHLEDGLSFKIFEKIEIDTPIIFTTAYDKYAIDAFKLNSIDYLLKPISREDLGKSVRKFKKFGKTTSSFDINELKKALQPEANYLKNFLVQYGTKIKKIKVENVAYFYAHEKAVYAVTNDGKKHILDKTLDNIEQSVDPRLFFRINRKIIVSEKSIVDMTAYSRSRIKLDLDPKTPNDVEAIVSIERSPDFKNWLSGK